MGIGKYGKEAFLFIFRNTKKPDRYFILYVDEQEAKWMFETMTRTGRYSVPPSDGSVWGYAEVPFEWVLQAEADEGFVNFIQRDIAEYEKDEVKDFGDWGWYILKEIDLEKWKALYQNKLSEQRKILKEVVQKEKKVEQIKMF